MFFIFWLKFLHALIKTCTCCRGSTGKCPVAICESSDLVLLHNKTSLQSWRGNLSSTANHVKHALAKMSNSIVWLHKTKNNPQIPWFPDLLLIKVLAALRGWGLRKSAFDFWSTPRRIILNSITSWPRSAVCLKRMQHWWTTRHSWISR